MVNRYRVSLVFATCSVLALGIDVAFPQTEVAISPSKDNTLYESPAGSLSNGAGSHFFVGRNNMSQNSIRRGLLAFDVAGNIPPGVTIETVTLTLHMSRTASAAGGHTVSLHKVVADWGEATSDAVFNEGGGADAMPGDATWIHTFFDTTNWMNPGGDFLAAASASQVVASTGFYTWGSAGQMVADVQSWLDSPAQNFGWLLIGNESTGQTAKRFDTKENETPENRPVLRVTYTAVTSVNENRGSLPAAPSLLQSYPNPIRQSQLQSSGSAIEFTLTIPTAVSLKIFNLLGQEVVALQSQRQFAAGQHLARWNGLDGDGNVVAPGVYFYRLQTPGQAQAKRFVILR